MSTAADATDPRAGADRDDTGSTGALAAVEPCGHRACGGDERSLSPRWRCELVALFEAGLTTSDAAATAAGRPVDELPVAVQRVVATLHTDGRGFADYAAGHDAYVRRRSGR